MYLNAAYQDWGQRPEGMSRLLANAPEHIGQVITRSHPVAELRANGGRYGALTDTQRRSLEQARDLSTAAIRTQHQRPSLDAAPEREGFDR
jgi:hypothetical protein